MSRTQVVLSLAPLVIALRTRRGGAFRARLTFATARAASNWDRCSSARRADRRRGYVPGLLLGGRVAAPLPAGALTRLASLAAAQRPERRARRLFDERGGRATPAGLLHVSAARGAGVGGRRRMQNLFPMDLVGPIGGDISRWRCATPVPPSPPCGMPAASRSRMCRWRIAISPTRSAHTTGRSESTGRHCPAPRSLLRDLDFACPRRRRACGNSTSLLRTRLARTPLFLCRVISEEIRASVPRLFHTSGIHRAWRRGRRSPLARAVMITVNTRQLFLALLRDLDIDLVCEVGSMNGEDALAFRTRLPRARIIALEPNPANLRAHARGSAPGGGRIESWVRPRARVDAHAPFFVVEADYASANARRGMSSLHQRDARAYPSTAVEVQTLRLDTLLAPPRGIAGWSRVSPCGSMRKAMPAKCSRACAAWRNTWCCCTWSSKAERCIAPEQRLYPEARALLESWAWANSPRTRRTRIRNSMRCSCAATSKPLCSGVSPCDCAGRAASRTHRRARSGVSSMPAATRGTPSPRAAAAHSTQVFETARQRIGDVGCPDHRQVIAVPEQRLPVGLDATRLRRTQG